MKTLICTAAAVALAAPAFAQTATVITVAQNDEFGQYLTDGDGRPVYMFTTDTRGTDDQAAQLSCTADDCQEAWPPVMAAGDPEAGDGADAALIGTTEYEGQQVVTYNGWPLYYFAQDAGAADPQGNDIESFGGEWYLLTPEGEEVEE